MGFKIIDEIKDMYEKRKSDHKMELLLRQK